MAFVALPAYQPASALPVDHPSTVVDSALQPQGILPLSGSLFGAAVFASSRLESTLGQSNLAFEAMIGRGMTLERRFFAWDDVFPTANEYLSRDLGRTLILSWGAGKRDGTIVPWADIAAGLHDAEIDARAADIKSFGAPMIFVFHHEPNGQHIAGTPQEFIDAFQHIRNRFVADGVTNVMYGMVMFDTAFDTGQINDYYPGDSYVDVLGVDTYNWYQCDGRNEPWTSLHDSALAFHDFGVAHNKPMILAEWGSEEDPLNPARKGQWITEAAATLKTWPEVKGVSWFNTGPPIADTCNWWVDSSPASLAAFQAIGADPYFNPLVKKPPITNLSYVNTVDNGYSGVNGYPAEGHGIKWLFQGPSSHSVTDNSGMGYFDSGTKAPGTSWTFTFLGAANYPYKCTLHSTMVGTLKVPLIVTPTSGSVLTRFSIIWASATPPAGFVYDVQIQRPGGSWYSYLYKDSLLKSGTFTPDTGVGTYNFRSRLKRSSTGKAANWSEVVAITVS
jgi:hypothetical protein